MAELKFLDQKQVREIRKRLGKNSSSIIVLGTGCMTDYLPTYLDDDSVSSLQSRDLNRLYEKWNELLKLSEEVEENGFLKSYFKELSQEMSLANSYIVNNSPISDIPERTTSRIKIVDLWGDVTQGIDVNTRKRTKVQFPIDREQVSPNFPDSLLSQKKRSVAEVEGAFVTDHIASVLIVGASGLCPVTESLFNQALSRKVPIIVVNEDRDCFMHSLAHISLVCSAQDFFHDLKLGFGEYDESY